MRSSAEPSGSGRYYLIGKTEDIHKKISNTQPKERIDLCMEGKAGLRGQWSRRPSGKERRLEERLVVAMPLAFVKQI